jgi:hypothetical protein
MQIDELWCGKCHAPRKAWKGIADIYDINPKKPNLEAICISCGNKIHKLTSPKNLAEIEKVFSIQMLHKAPLIQRVDCSNNDITEKE